MMTLRVRAIALAGLFTLTVGALAACDPGDPPTPTTTTVPSASPTPAPSEAPGAEFGREPESRYNVDCGDLATIAQLAASHAGSVAPTDPFATAFASDDGIPTAAVVLQLGGVACEWTNGAPMIENHQVSPGFVGTTINVLPDASTQWTRFTDTYGAGDSQLNCYSTGTVVNCDLNEFLAGSWIEVTTYGVNAPIGASPADFAAAIAPLLDGVRAAVASATVRAPEVIDEAFPIPSECDSVISGEQYGTAVGVGSTASGGPHGGWSLDAGARAMAESEVCIYFYPDADLAAGVVRWLPNAAWAAEASMAVATFPAAPADAGITGPEASWIRCAPANGQCTVDVTVNGNWLQVTVLADDTMGLPAPADRRAAALAATQIAIANVIGRP